MPLENQPLIILMPCSRAPKGNWLDVVIAVRVYINATACPVLKGHPASTNVWWISHPIARAYTLKGKSHPALLRTHATRSVDVSWKLVCKATMWSSVHMFSKFYHVDVPSSAHTAFGAWILQQHFDVASVESCCLLCFLQQFCMYICFPPFYSLLWGIPGSMNTQPVSCTVQLR